MRMRRIIICVTPGFASPSCGSAHYSAASEWRGVGRNRSAKRVVGIDPNRQS
jgi:hypothetical protein